MSLTLVAVTLNEQPLSQPITAVFDARGGTIGRADHNTMALPDPQRHVSRLQAEVVAHGAGFLIRNVGNANPINVGARPLGPGEAMPLDDGAQVRIGGYLLKASIGPDAPPAAAPVSPALALRAAAQRDAPPAAPPPPAPPPVASPSAPLTPFPAVAVAAPAPAPVAPPATDANPFADLFGTSSAPASAGATAGVSHDPFADLLGTTPGSGGAMAAAAPMPASPAALDPLADFLPAPAGVAPRSPAMAPPPAPSARLPDDFDPFAPVAPAAPAAPTSPQPPASADPFASIMPVADRSHDINALFDLRGGTASAADDPLAQFLAQPSPSTTTATPLDGGVSTDPLAALFGDGLAAPAPAAPQADQLPAVNAAWQAPRVQSAAPPAAPAPWAAPLPMDAAPATVAPTTPPPAAPAARPPAAAMTPSSAMASGDALWAAFCEGAGIDPRLAAADPAARMREIGRILRSAIDGTLQLVAVRASTKHELRAGVTVIQQRDNNPLKFSPDAKSGLEQLLQPPLRGFLGGPAAMDDVMHDLVGHAIGTVAGMRAAVTGMLDRFAPEALEAKLTGGSVLDSLLPMNRKARLWDLYLQHHGAIREEAQEDFHTLFGKAFLAAYEQQIERLRRETRGGS